jgi:hypothetical protein
MDKTQGCNGNQNEVSENQCKICSKKLSTSSSLQNHITTIHENIRLFECHICPAKFGLKTNSTFTSKKFMKN